MSEWMSGLVGKSVLVTGASGLIGAHLLARLEEAQRVGTGPARIVAVTKSGKIPALGPQFPSLSTEVAAVDLANPEELAQLPDADVVVHAAGYGQPDKFLADEFNTLAVNAEATLRLLRKTRSNGHFHFLSSSEVYSGLEVHQPSETSIGVTNTDHPRATYIEAKRFGEACVHAARRSSDIHATASRVALVYGPGVRLDDGRVMNEFIRSALTERRITLRDEGLAARTYCYVQDAVEMIMTIAVTGSETVYNVGGESRTTIRQLAESIGDLTESEVIIPTNPLPLEGAPRDVSLDLSRVNDLCRGVSFTSLEDGLQQTIAWHRKLLDMGVQE